MRRCVINTTISKGSSSKLQARSFTSKRAAEKLSAQAAKETKLKNEYDKLNYLEKMNKRMREHSTSLSLERMMDFCRHPTMETIIHSADFLRKELPIRLAREYKRMERLPLGLGSMPSLLKLKANHLRSFAEIEQFPRIKTEKDGENFNELLKTLATRNAPFLFTFSKSIFELKEMMIQHYRSVFPSHALPADTIDLTREENLQQQIEWLMTSRIGVNILIGQHLAISEQFRKMKESSSPRDDDYVGMICTKTKPYEVALSAIADAKYVCEREYGRAPEVEMEGETSIAFPYIPSHVYYILFELLKNSMEATVSFNSTPPPIKITFSGEGKEDCAIRISDQGGGMARSKNELAFSFTYSSKQIDIGSCDDLHDFTISQPMSGLGVGLPVARLYCRYFGGDLRLVSMEGNGTDVYIYLHRLMERLEPHVPLPK